MQETYSLTCSILIITTCQLFMEVYCIHLEKKKKKKLRLLFLSNLFFCLFFLNNFFGFADIFFSCFSD